LHTVSDHILEVSEGNESRPPHTDMYRLDRIGSSFQKTSDLMSLDLLGT